MKTLGTAGGLLTALFFVLALPCAVWTFATSATALDPTTYKAALANEDIYGQLLPALIPALVEANALENAEADNDLTEQERAERDILLAIIGNMDEQDWRAITAELLPSEQLRSQVEGGLDAFFAWLNGDGPITDLHIDMTYLKDQLAGDAGQRTVNRIMNTWPTCSDEQVAMLADLPDPATFTFSPTDFPFCQPPGEYVATTSAVLSSTLANIAQQIPDALPDPAAMDSLRFRREAEGVRRGIDLARALVIELLLVPLALLALTVTLVVRSLKSFGRWGGWMLIIGGIFALVPVLLIFPVIIPGLVRATSLSPSDLPGPAQAPSLSYVGFIMQEVLLSFLGAFSLPILILSAVVIGVGFVLLAISVALRSNEEVIADQVSLATANTAMPLAPSDRTTAQPLGDLPPPE